MAVESRHGIPRVFGTNCPQVKNAEVHKEGIVHGTGEYLLARAGHHDTFFHLLVVACPQTDRLVIDRTGADVGRRHDTIGNDRLESTATIHAALAGVGGFQVFLTQADEEKSSRILVHLFELEAVDDVRAGCTRIVVHVNFIANAFPERVPVGATSGVLERNIVGDQHDVLIIGRTPERIHVRVIGQRVIGN